MSNTVKKVTFTLASTSDAGFTVTANRLNEAGFNRVDSNNLFKGERYTAELKDSFGRVVTTKLTVNRSKLDGNTYTSLYSEPLAGRGLISEPVVGTPVELTVVSLRKIRNRG